MSIYSIDLLVFSHYNGCPLNREYPTKKQQKYTGPSSIALLYRVVGNESGS